jgi:hypothetical protein
MDDKTDKHNNRNNKVIAADALEQGWAEAVTDEAVDAR